MPCATVSDERLLWGTSRAQQQELTMVKNASAQPGTRLRLNFGRLREFLTAFAKARSAQNPGDTGLRETIRWLAPLGVLDWSARAVGGTAVTRFSLGMKDIPAYD
ncbi:MAG: hypothetical protein JNG86_01710 [Verrucomicrobiaceae bacterium]|nr:hypothetical protein [Verrucomicrobiaceae bacterium]